MHKIAIAIAVILMVLVAVLPASAQTSFQKWDMYAGYSYLNTPTNDIAQHGFNLSFGRNINKWLALGMDFSRHEGTGAQNATGTDMVARLPSTIVAGLPASLAPALLTDLSLRRRSQKQVILLPSTHLRRTRISGAFFVLSRGAPQRVTATLVICRRPILLWYVGRNALHQKFFCPAGGRFLAIARRLHARAERTRCGPRE
jgi:hypothetical protein